MTGRGAEAGHAGGSSARAAVGSSTTPASQGSRALSRPATSDATVKPGPRRTVPGWRRRAANAVMHCRSHSGAHNGFTGAPRGSGGNVHVNGRRSTRPSGSASDEDARDCKPTGFAVSTPSGEGAAGDGGFLPKLSRRRFPSPFSLSRICSIGGGGGGEGGGSAARPVPLALLRTAGRRFGGELRRMSETSMLRVECVQESIFPLSARHTRQTGTDWEHLP